MRFLKDKNFVKAFVLLVLLPGCVVSNSELSFLRQDVDALKKENASLRKVLGKGSGDLLAKLTKLEKKVDKVTKEASRANADSHAEVESLRAEFRQMTGGFEESKHEIDKSSAASSAFIASVDGRMTNIENKILQLSERLAVLESKLSTLESRKATAAPQKSVAENTITVKRPASDIYKDGLDAIKTGKTEIARSFFRDYLDAYPDGPLANNAQFWIGESFYDEKEYERAILEFDEVVKKYPEGGKVPAAIFKQAMSFEMLKNAQAAEALYRKLLKSHPGTDEARLAKKKLEVPKKKSSAKKKSSQKK